MRYVTGNITGQMFVQMDALMAIGEQDAMSIASIKTANRVAPGISQKYVIPAMTASTLVRIRIVLQCVRLIVKHVRLAQYARNATWDSTTRMGQLLVSFFNVHYTAIVWKTPLTAFLARQDTITQRHGAKVNVQ